MAQDLYEVYQTTHQLFDERSKQKSDLKWTQYGIENTKYYLHNNKYDYGNGKPDYFDKEGLWKGLLYTPMALGVVGLMGLTIADPVFHPHNPSSTEAISTAILNIGTTIEAGVIGGVAGAVIGGCLNVAGYVTQYVSRQIDDIKNVFSTKRQLPFQQKEVEQKLKENSDALLKIAESTDALDTYLIDFTYDDYNKGYRDYTGDFYSDVRYAYHTSNKEILGEDLIKEMQTASAERLALFREATIFQEIEERKHSYSENKHCSFKHSPAKQMPKPNP